MSKYLKAIAAFVYVGDVERVPRGRVVAGDHDPYNQTAKFVELFQLLPKGELAIIPGCGHVVLDCKGPYTISAVDMFLDQKEK